MGLDNGASRWHNPPSSGYRAAQPDTRVPRASRYRQRNPAEPTIVRPPARLFFHFGWLCVLAACQNVSGSDGIATPRPDAQRPPDDMAETGFSPFADGALDGLSDAGRHSADSGSADGGSADGTDAGSTDAAETSDATAGADAATPLDADPGAPDGASPACRFPPELSVHLVDDRLYRRGEAAEIRVDVANSGELELERTIDTPQGGRITERSDHFFWAAGDNEPGDVDWPWWTGPATIRVTVTDATGCSTTESVEVSLGGDVLLTDGERGGLYAYGSNGVRFGLFAQVGDRQGLGSIIPLPPAPDGARGFVALLRRSGNGEIALVRLDADGRRVGEPFEMTDLTGEALYDDGREPQDLIYDPARGEILADYSLGSVVHRWSLDGNYMGVIEIPYDGVGPQRPLGFALLDGEVVVGHEQHDDMYVLPAQGPPRIFRGADRDQIDDTHALTSGHGGVVIAIMRRGQSYRALAYDTDGRDAGAADWYLHGPTQMVRFFDGYLSVSVRDLAVRAHAPTLEMPAPGDYWQETGADGGPRTPNGIVWLN